MPCELYDPTVNWYGIYNTILIRYVRLKSQRPNLLISEIKTHYTAFWPRKNYYSTNEEKTKTIELIKMRFGILKKATTCMAKIVEDCNEPTTNRPEFWLFSVTGLQTIEISEHISKVIGLNYINEEGFKGKINFKLLLI